MTAAPAIAPGPCGAARARSETLATALDRVHQRLTAPQPPAQQPPTQRPAASFTAAPHGDPPSSALTRLQELFDLTEFELDVLILCAGAALEARFPAACAILHGDQRATWPTLGLALATLDAPHWSAISRTRPLRYWRLIEVGAGALLHAPLQIDERILQHLLGIPALDERMESLIRALAVDSAQRPGVDGTALHGALRGALQSWRRTDSRPELLLLTGPQASLRRAAFLELCGRCDCRPYVMNLVDLPPAAAERDQLARLWNREAALEPAALYVEMDHDGADLAAGLRTLSVWLKQVHTRVALDLPHGGPGRLLPGLRVEIPDLSTQQRKQAWQAHLGPVAERMNGALDRIVEYFRFDEAGIRLSAAAARHGTDDMENEPGKATWDVCRQFSRRALEGLAHRIEARASWQDLVLPPEQTATLQHIAIHLRQRAVVNDSWGFAGRHSRGLGLSALFAGDSGTGKTMAAEIIARELDLDLYQIDLAGMVSKYIGETEKNLRRIFDAAEESGAVLLFDEADALFGKRSEVRDSHDRYANLEVSYLLQRMDSYRGVAILTTNMRHALDAAFLRRIRFIVQFPFPDEASRTRIWERVFPRAAPLDPLLDFAQLAQLNVPGGVIRNLAMHAAFLAAERGGTIGAAQVLAAARLEYSKLDRPLTPAEVRGWA